MPCNMSDIDIFSVQKAMYFSYEFWVNYLLRYYRHVYLWESMKYTRKRYATFIGFTLNKTLWLFD